MPSILLFSLSLLACKDGPSTPDKAQDTADSGHTGSSTDDTWPSEREVLSGDQPGAGFGTRLATDGEEIWIAAPYGDGGQVWAWSTAEVVSDGAWGYGLGLGAGPVVGNPVASEGAGEVQGAVISGTTLLGGAVFVDDGLLSSTASGVVVDGAAMDLGIRVGAVARVQERVIAGLPFGDHALAVDGTTMARVEPYDEAGSALCVGDLDGDLVDDLAVGAPGASRAYLLLGDAGTWDLDAAIVLQGEGRFGASLACGAGRLAVGAPMEGGEVEGAVYVFEGDPSTWTVGSPRAVGAPGGTLGWAVAMTEDSVFVGEPGGAEDSGIVHRLEL